MSLQLQNLGTRVISIATFPSDWEGFDHDRNMSNALFTIAGLAIEGRILDYSEHGTSISITFACHKNQYHRLEAACNSSLR